MAISDTFTRDFGSEQETITLTGSGTFLQSLYCYLKPFLPFDCDRDANLWRPKVRRLSFFTNPPPRKIDPAPNGNDLGHYMTSYMMYILSKFEIIVLMLEIIFVND